MYFTNTPVTGLTRRFLCTRTSVWDYSINNRVPCIVPFLSMIVMIKGIYLITGLLNYSSVEARLFRRMLIVLRSPRHILAFICWFHVVRSMVQHFVKTATKNKK
jgi:hypothetical protein